MSVTVPDVYIPSPMQFAAHTCPADELLYGGAAGGGKTEFLLQESNRTAMLIPGSKSVFFRRNWAQIEAPKSRAQQIMTEARYVGGHQSRFRFNNRSEVRMSHLQRKADVNSHDSEEYDLISFDEGGSFAPEQIRYLRTRNRSSIVNSWPRLRIGANPGGPCHHFLFSEFIRPKEWDDIAEVLYYWPIVEASQLWEEVCARYDMTRRDQQEAAKQEWHERREAAGINWRPFSRKERLTLKGPLPGLPPRRDGKSHDDLRYIVWRPVATDTEREAGITPATRCFLPSLIYDNPIYANDSTYLSNLARQPESVRRALLDGDWTVFEGQFFREFDEKIHVIDPIVPQPWWVVWRSMDWGISEPGVVGWHTIHPDTGQKITFRELRFQNSDVRDVVRLVQGMTSTNERVLKTLADPSMFRRAEEASRCLADTFADAGMPLTPANNARVPGWTQVRSEMALNPSTGKPYWVATSNCRYLIETLPALVHSQKNPEDIDTDGEDHAADMLRYGLMDAPSTMLATGGLTINLGTVRI